MKKELILVADDNQKNLYLTRFLLEKSGLRVEEAHTGEEALRAVNRYHPALVLMDIQMPGMDGLEATRRIKTQIEPPPVVALTAKIMIDERNEIFNAGCDGIIEKPINPLKFVSQIEAFITRE